MKWTTEKPKAEGWYWVRGAYVNDLVFQLDRIGNSLYFGDEVNSWRVETETAGLQFCGPIVHPDGLEYPYPPNS